MTLIQSLHSKDIRHKHVGKRSEQFREGQYDGMVPQLEMQF